MEAKRENKALRLRNLMEDLSPVTIRFTAWVTESTPAEWVGSPARQNIPALPGLTCFIASIEAKPVMMPTFDMPPKQTNNAVSGILSAIMTFFSSSLSNDFDLGFDEDFGFYRVGNQAVFSRGLQCP